MPKKSSTSKRTKPKSTRRTTTTRRKSGEVAELRARLNQAEQTLGAIHGGEVDALVVAGPQGERIFTLKGAEQPYRHLVEEMSDGALVLSADATILYANRRVSTLLDVPLQSLVSHSFSRFVSEGDHSTFEALLREGMKGTSQGEVKIMRGDALVPTFISLNHSEIEDEPTAVVTVTDLSEQKRSESIVAAEKLARSILDQAAEAIVVCDETGRIVRANSQAQMLAGRNPMLQRFEFVFPLRHVANAEDKAAWFTLDAALRGEALCGVGVALMRDDHLSRLLLSASPLYDAQNQSIGCVITLTDISERERTHDQLRFQATILQNVSDSVIVTDIQGRVMYWNEGACKVFGYDEQEMLGQTVARLYPTQNAEKLAAELLDVLEGTDYMGEWEGRHKNGARVWVEITTRLLRDSDGRILGFLGIAKEITARKEAEQTRQREAFLARVGSVLGSSLDYETTLVNVAQLAVPHIADWCTVSVLDERGRLQPLAIAHSDPSKVALAREYQQRYPPEDNSPIWVALRTGTAQLLSEIPDAAYEQLTDPEQQRLARQMGLKSYMIVPMMSAGRALGVIAFVSGESGRAYDRNDLAFAEALAGRAALAVENAHLYREAQRLNTELEQRVLMRTAELNVAVMNLKGEVRERERAEARVRSLLRLSSQLNSTLDLDALLDLLAQDAVQLVDARRGCAGLRVGDTMQAQRYFEPGRAIEQEIVWPSGHGLAGWSLQHKQPYLTNDAAHDPQLQTDRSFNDGARSALCMPVLDARGEVLGFFNLRDKKSDEGFTAADIELLGAVAQIAAIAIQNALAYRRIQQGERQLRRLSAHLQVAREEERTRIAREIHDELGQVLTALKMDLSLLGRKVGDHAQQAHVLHEIQTMGKLIDTAIQTVREIITELRPEMLEDLGLKAAMEWQAQEFETRTGITCNFEMQLGDERLDREHSMALFRILQESLTNVARHAQATAVEVRFAKDNGDLWLRIHDNGKGITPQELATTKSFGILGMRERTVLFGGTLDISSAPGAGTTISVRVPTRRAAGDAA